MFLPNDSKQSIIDEAAEKVKCCTNENTFSAASLYREYGYLKAMNIEHLLTEQIKKDNPEIEKPYSREDLAEVQRILLTRNIWKIMTKMEEKAFEDGNPIVPES